MHELALATAIRDTVLRHAEGRRVSTVRMRVGTMRQVGPESLDFYFRVVARGTLCDGSRLELQVTPSVLRCGRAARAGSRKRRAFAARAATDQR
jgi:hydrogenase nickel incorporation protein HypA/HybF